MPETVPMPMDEQRESAAYNVSATALVQRQSGFEPLPDHENLRARVYPYSQGQSVGQFDTSRKITDRIKFDAYYPRFNSGLYVRALQPSGEVVMYEVQDVEHDGDPQTTTLIARRRGVDRK